MSDERDEGVPTLCRLAGCKREKSSATGHCGFHDDLRDRFAAAALTGMCAFDGPVPGIKPGEFVSMERMARDSYHIADAMLAAREWRKR